MVYGIDVSSYQGDVNWPRVASDGITFAHAKSSEGHSYRDPKFEQNRKGAQAVGVHFGPYHFAQPDHNPPKREAYFFYSVAGKSHVGDVRHVLDLEAGHGNLTLWAGTFLAQLEQLVGARPMYYSGAWFLGPHINHGALSGYGYWDSSYGPNDAREHPAALPNVEHQFTSNARILGVIGRVDKNSAPSLAPLLVPGPINPVKPDGPPGPEVWPERKNGLPFTRGLWPVPVPAWFWAWAQWRQDGQTYQRPWDAPTVIPPWAWVRLRQLQGGKT